MFHNTLVVGSSPTGSTTQSPTTGYFRRFPMYSLIEARRAADKTTIKRKSPRRRHYVPFDENEVRDFLAGRSDLSNHREPPLARQ